jgi:hypothetical protein
MSDKEQVFMASIFKPIVEVFNEDDFITPARDPIG